MNELTTLSTTLDNNPVLTLEQERECCTNIRTWLDTKKPSREIVAQGLKAKEKLVYSNIRLALHYAQQYSNDTRAEHYQDLVAEGCVGICIAAERYNHNKGAKFSYYAAFWIKQRIFKFFRNRDTIRLPDRFFCLRTKVIKYTTSYIDEHQATPTTEQIADYLKVPEQDVDLVLGIGRKISLNAYVDEDREIGEIIPDTSTKTPATETCLAEIQELITTGIDTLTAVQKDVIIRRYGLNNQDVQTFEEIGKVHKFTRQRAQQIEMDAIKRLKYAIKSLDSDIIEFYNTENSQTVNEWNS